MFSVNSTAKSDSFALKVSTAIMLDVANVLGQVGKPAMRSVAGSIEFMEVFNCLATLRYACNTDRYIANEEGDSRIWVNSWNNARLAGFMDLIVQGKVDGLSPSQREMESLRVLCNTLRPDNDHNYQH